MKIKANGVQIEVLDEGGNGAPQQPVVLLVMGLGMQLTAWPEDFVQGLLQAGYRVIRHDNRDCGLSQSLDHLGKPILLLDSMKYKFGWPLKPPYTLLDMARDALGVLDALGVARAHVAGVSMGGMIAQRMALVAPERVHSLTSIMSTSSARHLPPPQPEVIRALLCRPSSKTLEAAVSNYLVLMKVISSPAFALTDAQWFARVDPQVRRAYRPDGTLRQLVATIADADRADLLGCITAPTLVLHGKADPMLPYVCGQDTARRIPGAQLVGIDGMGHDLPPGVVRILLTHLLAHLRACTRDASEAQPA
ncbi:MAG: alpha/beta fold hydrolase [Burkholderiaceae bacterium]